MTGTTSAQIIDTPTYHQHHDDEKSALRRLGLATIGDLTTFNGERRVWNPELQYLSKITEEIMQTDCPQGNMKLRPQQCWLVQDQTEAYVAEILGFIESDAVIRKWVIQLSRYKKKGKIVIELTKVRLARHDKFLGKELIIHPDSYTRGEGSRCKIPTKLLEMSKQRVIIGSDARNRTHGLHRIVCGIIPEEHPSRLIPENLTDPTILQIAAQLGDTTGTWDIFVDGSHKKTGGPFTSVLFEEDCTVEASASLIFMRRADTWRNTRTLVIRITNGGAHKPSSAFPLELLALTTADIVVRKLQLEAVIFSDCTGAIKSLSDKGRLRYLAKKQNLLLLQQSKRLTAKLKYVRSHPERYSKDKTQWTRHMWGNHLADRACVPDLTDFDMLGDLRSLQCTATQTLQLFTKEDTMYWADREGNPTLSTFESLFDERLQEDYERKRD